MEKSSIAIGNRTRDLPDKLYIIIYLTVYLFVFILTTLYVTQTTWRSMLGNGMGRMWKGTVMIHL
jgi:hypothetical protein